MLLLLFPNLIIQLAFILLIILLVTVFSGNRHFNCSDAGKRSSIDSGSRWNQMVMERERTSIR